MSLVVSVLESQFTGDPKGFDQAADHVETRSKQLENARPKVEIDAEVQDALAKMGQVDDEGNALATRDYDPKIDADITKAEGKVSDIGRELEVLRRLETSPEVDADIAKATAKLDTAQGRLRALEGLRAEMVVDADPGPAEKALDDVADKAEDAGTDGGKRSGRGMITGIVAALATIPIAGALVGIASAAADAVVQGFQEGLAVEVRADRLAATTGLDEATVGRLGRAAGEAYAQNWGESIEANMDTARAAIQSGLLDPQATERDAQAIIESLSGVSDILGEEIPRVTRSAQQLLRTGLAKDASEAFDIIVKGQQAGLNVSEDWLDTLDEYSIQWQKLGLEGGDVLGLLSQGVQAGARDTDIAADAFKELAIRAVDGSKLTAEGFEAIGENAEEMGARFAAGGDSAREALGDTLDGLRKIEDPIARDAAAVALFGTQAEDLGAALYAMDLDTAAKQFDDLEGAADRALSTLGGNTAGTIAMAQRNIEVAADGIKGALAEAFAPQIEGFATFVSENREAVVQFLFDAANGAIDFGRALAEGAAAGTEGFGDLVATVGPGILDLIQSIIEGLDSIPFVDLTDAVEDFKELRKGAEESFKAFDEGTGAAAEGIRKNLIENGLDPAQNKLNDLGSGLINNAALSDATNRLANEISGVGFAADGSKVSMRLLDGEFDTSTKSGRLLDEQVRGVVRSLNDQVQSAANAGESQKQLRGRVRDARDAFIDQVTALGLTQDEAKALAREYGLIPKKVLTDIEADGGQARSEARETKSYIDSLNAAIKVAADGGSAYEEARAIQAYINGLNATITVTDRHVSSGLPGSRSGGNTRAIGGPIWADETYLVGEDGPELVRFSQAGTVIPAGQTAQILAGGNSRAPSGGTTYAPVINNFGDKVTAQTVVMAQRHAELLNL